MVDSGMLDQAAGLRRLFGQRASPSVAFAHVQRRAASGLQLARVAHGLAAQGQRVVIVDEHQGKESITAIGGHAVRHELFDAFLGDCSLADVMIRVAPKIWVVPASRAAREFGRGEVDIEARMAACLAELGCKADLLLIDGMLRQGRVSRLVSAASHLALVARPAKGSITEAYSLIKQIGAQDGREVFHIVLDQVGDRAAAGRIVRNLRSTVQQHLAADLVHLASLGRDVSDLVEGLQNRLPSAPSNRWQGLGPLRLRGMFGPSALLESVL